MWHCYPIPIFFYLKKSVLLTYLLLVKFLNHNGKYQLQKTVQGNGRPDKIENQSGDEGEGK